MTDTFYGYPAQVWEACYASVQWLSGSLSATNPVQSTAAVATVYSTLRNGVFAVQAWGTLNALQSEFVLLQEVESLPLSLNAQNEALFTARITAIQAMLADLPNYIPAVQPVLAMQLLQQGKPAIPYTGYIEGLMQSRYEAVPSGLAYNSVRGHANAQTILWTTIRNKILVLQGMFLTGAYDAANRMMTASTVSTEVIQALIGAHLPFDPNGISGASDLSTLWNQTVALPTFLGLAHTLSASPHTFINQECGAIRYALAAITDQLALLLIGLRKSVYSTVNLAEIRNGDSLLDVAARNTGNFENWSAIATLNGLLPPWVAPVSGSSVAQYGSDVLLPPAAGTILASGYPVPSYSVNVLGTDLYLGPINQPMLPWTGDFETISGYDNLAISLGRRLQTPIGDLVYHTEYGSRIPPEVGAVQDQYDLQRICVYAESALLSDPRVASVLGATATAPNGANSTVNFTGAVQPIGTGVQSVQINETLAPIATGVTEG